MFRLARVMTCLCSADTRATIRTSVCVLCVPLIFGDWSRILPEARVRVGLLLISYDHPGGCRFGGRGTDVRHDALHLGPLSTARGGESSYGMDLIFWL